MFWQRAEVWRLLKQWGALFLSKKNGPRMQCAPAFCLGTRREPLNPVLHFNQEGLLMFLELFHLVNCFEFYMRLGFVGIAGGDAETASSKLYKPWIRTMAYITFTHFIFQSNPIYMASEDFPICWLPWVSLMWPRSAWLSSAWCRGQCLCTILQHDFDKGASLVFSQPYVSSSDFGKFVISVWVS